MTTQSLENECYRLTQFDAAHNCYVCACDTFYNSADYMTANAWEGECEHTQHMKAQGQPAQVANG